MAEEIVVEIKNDFYRDSFGKVVFIILSICAAIFLLIGISLYLYLNKPQPITFGVDPEWRVQAAVPINQPYLETPDLLQWVSDALQKVFVFDFYHYNDQLQKAAHFFTPSGWKVFLNQLNIYVNYNSVQTNKQFVSAAPTGAPFILQQGLLSGRYAWWVQMPISITYTSYNRSSVRAITLQVLVVRVPTLNNLDGVGIENVIVAGGTGAERTGTS
ncbi:DotI/IcmL/TraM family protein [Aquicella lusitana]|uniref:Intracellular multiplication protein IcmL n=1 Tax=Aquicella lusitana TaxID=254246 RepID=A0A370H0W4_9COXI|nr:DotI/IcmL/TraM family protein [Aquicella lusitana]RDI48614.1 intracellular multiplication protein IcmL [Aquicella lusitana]VVC74009.1 hypothetical protein AQULUS_17710 [Aquicella lusitana]